MSTINRACSSLTVLSVTDNSEKYLYLHRDYLGSIVMLTYENGNIAERRHFDPWGQPIKVEDAAGNTLDKLTLLDRGFTGHEHLASVGLIHMNGRLYDPALHRFLQPDNYIQDPFNTQSFNRYGYCLNNPLVYNDITGEWFGIDDLIAAVVGGVINLAVNAIQGNVTSWGSALGYFGVGAVSGWASLYVGPFAVGAISGLGNYITTQVSQGGWSSLNFDDGVTATAIGAATSWAGAKIGGWATKNLGGIFSSISSPVLRQAAVNSVGGAVSGFAIGTAVSYIQYKDFDRAFSEGVRGGLMGAGIGLTTGAIGGYIYAKENKLSP